MFVTRLSIPYAINYDSIQFFKIVGPSIYYKKNVQLPIVFLVKKLKMEKGYSLTSPYFLPYLKQKQQLQWNIIMYRLSRKETRLSSWKWYGHVTQKKEELRIFGSFHGMTHGLSGCPNENGNTLKIEIYWLSAHHHIYLEAKTKIRNQVRSQITFLFIVLFLDGLSIVTMR